MGYTADQVDLAHKAGIDYRIFRRQLDIPDGFMRTEPDEIGDQTTGHLWLKWKNGYCIGFENTSTPLSGRLHGVVFQPLDTLLQAPDYFVPIWNWFISRFPLGSDHPLFKTVAAEMSVDYKHWNAERTAAKVEADARARVQRTMRAWPLGLVLVVQHDRENNKLRLIWQVDPADY